MSLETMSPSILPDWKGAGLIALIAALCFWDLGRVELSVTDEARSAVIVRDMAEGGRWLLPRTPDGALSEKPPVYYGLCAALGTCAGISEWTLRGVSVIMGVGTLLLTWILARLYGSPWAARVAVVALAANVLFVDLAREALVDMTMTFFLTAGLVAYFASRLGRLRPGTSAVICGISFGLAVLTKGPLGLVLPAAVVGADALLEYRGRFWNARCWGLPGMVAVGLAAALACAWYLPGYLKGGKEFIETCVLSENLRMPLGKAQGLGVSHSKSLVYYFGIQLAAVIAGAPFLPALAGWKKVHANGPALQQLGTWFCAGFLLFEIAANKRMYYLLPLQPPVAVLLGLAAEHALSAGSARLLKGSSAAVGMASIVVSIGILAICGNPGWMGSIRDGSVAEALRQQRAWVGVFAGGLFILGLFMIRAAFRGSGVSLGMGCLFAMFAVAVRVGPGDRLLAEFDRTRPFVAEVIPKLKQDEVPVIMPPIRGYSIDFYWPTRLTRSETGARKAGLVLVARPRLAEFGGSYEILGTWRYGANGRDDIILLRKAGVR